MTSLAEDEKRIFEALERELNDELEGDSYPDPDETLSFDHWDPENTTSAWKIKIPEPLMERWAAVQEADVHLATLRIYEADRKDKKSKPRCFLFLPPNRDPVNAPVNVPSSKSKLSSSSNPRRGALQSTRPSPSFVHPEVKDWPSFGPKLYDPVYKPYNCLPTTGRDEPDIYELEICEKELESSYIVAYPPKEHNPKAPGYNPRAQPTNLMGTVKRQGFAKRVMSASYRRSVKERHKKANAPKRLVKRMEMSEMKKHLKGKGKTVFTANSSGTRGDPPFVAPKEGKPKEKMVRLPRNEALDVLFDFFREKTRWRIGEIREATQQPEAYLRQLLTEIAFQHQKGTFTYLWELKPEFAVKAQQGVLIKEWGSPPSDSANPVKKEQEKENVTREVNGDDDDDEDDWEEVPTA